MSLGVYFRSQNASERRVVVCAGRVVNAHMTCLCVLAWYSALRLLNTMHHDEPPEIEISRAGAPAPQVLCAHIRPNEARKISYWQLLDILFLMTAGDFA